MTTGHPSLQMRATAVRNQLFQAGRILDTISESLGSLRSEQDDYQQAVLSSEVEYRNERLAAIEAEVAAADSHGYPTVTQLRARALIKNDPPELVDGIPASDFDELADVISLRSPEDGDLSEEELEFERRFSDFTQGDTDDASRRWFTGS